MTASIEFTNKDRLEFDAARHALRLTPAIGGAQIELSLTVAKVSAPMPLEEEAKVPEDRERGPLRHQVAATVYLSTRNPQQDRRYLCQIEAEYLVAPAARQTTFRARGFLSDHQLRVVEELRAGKAVWLILQLEVLQVEGRPGRLTQATGELSFTIGAGEWSEQLEYVDAGAFVEVLVPLGGGEAYGVAVGRIRKARGLLRENKIDEALGQARQALDPVREFYSTRAVASDARKRESSGTREDRDLKKRTLEERWAFMVEDLYATLSGALHDDDTTKTFEYSRVDGVALVASAAGMLARMGEERNRLG